MWLWIKMKRKAPKIRLWNFTCKECPLLVECMTSLFKSPVFLHIIFIVSPRFPGCCCCYFSFTVVAAYLPLFLPKSSGLLWLVAGVPWLEFWRCSQATAEDWTEPLSPIRKETAATKKCIAEKFFLLRESCSASFQRLKAPKLCLWCSAVINHRTNDAALLRRHAGNILFWIFRVDVIGSFKSEGPASHLETVALRFQKLHSNRLPFLWILCEPAVHCQSHPNKYVLNTLTYAELLLLVKAAFSLYGCILNLQVRSSLPTRQEMK